jgi:hypothetical protein
VPARKGELPLDSLPMKPAERIPLLKGLARALADIDNEREIDLTLRQFGFDVGPVYGDPPDFYGYALNQLERAGTDDALLELERFLDPAANDPVTRPATNAPGPWKGPDTFRLFVSHAHSTAAVAGEMRNFLRDFLVEAFVAHDDIEPSEKWQQVIESALLTCHAAVALVTPDFRESKWCDQEIGFCIARSICVVPLLYGVDPHGFLGGFQGVKLNSPTYPYAAGRQAGISVLNIVASRPETRERMVPSIVRRYSASFSFDNTREVFPQLLSIPVEAWTPTLVAEVEMAAEANRQVFDAILPDGRAPDMVAKVLAPIKEQLSPDPNDFLF